MNRLFIGEKFGLSAVVGDFKDRWGFTQATSEAVINIGTAEKIFDVGYET
jgi:hypothetical protein